MMNQEQDPKREKRWDSLISSLLTRNPQAFVDFLEPGCRFVRHYRNKLPNTQLQPDGIVGVERPWRAPFIAHIECESESNEEIGFRGLCYNVLIRREFKLPAKTYDLELTGGENKERPDFLHLTIPGPEPGQEESCIDFSYQRVVMSRRTPKDILDLGHSELLVLIPFTNGGLEYSVLKNMLSHLQAEGDKELLLHGYATTTYMLRKKKKFQLLEALQKEFSDMIDILRDTPVYDWIFDDGKAKGKAEGKAEGLEEGKALGKAEGLQQGLALGQAQTMAQTRQATVQVVKSQFPQLAQAVEETLAQITDQGTLMHCVFQLAQARSTEQVMQILFEIQQEKGPAIGNISALPSQRAELGKDEEKLNQPVALVPQADSSAHEAIRESEQAQRAEPSQGTESLQLPDSTNSPVNDVNE